MGYHVCVSEASAEHIQLCLEKELALAKVKGTVAEHADIHCSSKIIL